MFFKLEIIHSHHDFYKVYNDPAATIKKIPDREPLFILGDFNTRVGADHNLWKDPLFPVNTSVTLLTNHAGTSLDLVEPPFLRYTLPQASNTITLNRLHALFF